MENITENKFSKKLDEANGETIQKIKKIIELDDRPGVMIDLIKRELRANHEKYVELFNDFTI